MAILETRYIYMYTCMEVRLSTKSTCRKEAVVKFICLCVCFCFLKGSEIRLADFIHEMLRKKGKQHNTTERQSNKTQLAQGSYFSTKKLPQVGFKPTTVGLLGVALTCTCTHVLSLVDCVTHTPYPSAIWSFSVLLVSCDSLHACSWGYKHFIF